MVRRVRGLLGLPVPEEDDRVFSDADAEAAKSLRMFLDAGFGEEEIGEITRVLGESMSRLAATTTGAFVDTFLEPGDSEQDVALRFAGLAQELAPKLAPVLEGAFSAHLREAVRRGILGRAERETGQVGGAQEMAVCFADLVGFTRLGGEVEPEELGSVAVKLGELATKRRQAAGAAGQDDRRRGDVRQPRRRGALVDVGADVGRERRRRPSFPRCAPASPSGPRWPGRATSTGTPSTLQAASPGAARPGSVLCTKEVRDAALDDFHWSSAGRHKLKGLSSAVPLYRARRPDGRDDSDATEQKAGRRRKRASS